MYSLIVSVYKVEAYLPQCIDSILGQTYQDFELILVDDGSPDRCPQICDQYAEKDARVRVVHKENGGIVSTRIAGLEVASGEYICFVDGDDFLSCDMLEAYEKVLNKQKVDVICAGYSTYYGEDNIVPVSPKLPLGIYDKDKLQEEVYTQMLSGKPFYSYYMIPTVWSKCFKKSVIERNCLTVPSNISLGEDVAFTYPALLDSSFVCIIDYCGYMYRQNQNSMTHSYDKGLYEKIRALIVYLKFIEKEKQWNAKEQINEYTVYLLILAKNNEFKFNCKEKYSVRKKNMKRYLTDPLFQGAIKQVQVSGLKNRVIISCFRHRLLFPIYLYEAVMK